MGITKVPYMYGKTSHTHTRLLIHDQLKTLTEKKLPSIISINLKNSQNLETKQSGLKFPFLCSEALKSTYLT